MFVRHCKFEDFDGHMREEDHYFNLTKAETMSWLVTEDGYTLDELLKYMINERNPKNVMDIVSDLIVRSYGKKSPDGRRFDKSKEISDDFKATQAYSDMFMELSTDTNKILEFITGIIPKDLNEHIDKMFAEKPDETPEELKAFLAERRRSVPMLVKE